MKKIEYSEFVNCKTYKTAYKKLSEKINKMYDNSGLDNNYFDCLIESFGVNHDFKEYWKNENGTFFRLQIEELTEGRFYIDCAFTYDEE